MSLLREAAIEARALYPELHSAKDPWPVNTETPPKGTYLIAYLDGTPIAMGAHRPLDNKCSEVRRMFTHASARRSGAAKAILKALEAHAVLNGFTELKLETGIRQEPAIALYNSMGYHRIEGFGSYRNDPTSVCLAKSLQNGAA